MRSNKIWKFLMAILISLTLINFIYSQEGRGKGRINGLVQDEAGAPIANAKIKVTSLADLNIEFNTIADETGKWALLGLGTGMWRVMASAEGFYPAFMDIDVKQLQRNPEVVLALKKIAQSEMPTIQDEASFSLFEQGNQFFVEKKYNEAISAYEQFLEANPDAYQTYLNVGNCYKEKGDLDEALEEYTKVLERAREEKEDLSGNEIAARALAAIGEVYLKKEDYENAQKYFKNSIEIYPKDEVLAYNVGEIYFSNHRIDEALHYFELSKQIKPDWESPYLKLGYVYLNKGDFAKAEENLKKFLEMAPESPEAPNVRSIIDYLEKKK